MLAQKKAHPKEKTKLHPRNQHRERYDFELLTQAYPALTAFVKRNEYGDDSIDFFNPEAVKALNKALLRKYYDIEYWNIPDNYLCPPIPGRADYVHYIADVLAASNNKTVPIGSKIRCLDIGVGANCVYPIIGTKEYGWSFIGTDIDSVAIQAAQKIVDTNDVLKEKVELRWQANTKDILRGAIRSGEFIELTICNPPFHSSLAEAQAGTMRKLTNLTGHKNNKPTLNFGGQNNELWCVGGEARFIQNMILQSKDFSNQCFWFSTLVSKQSNLKSIYETLKKVEAVEVKTIVMGQGNKVSRLVAWTFLSPAKQQAWVARWNNA